MWSHFRVVTGPSLVLAWVASACGGPKEAESPHFSQQSLPRESAVAAPVEVVSSPITQLERRDVVDAVDAGLGSFLGQFETEASLNERGEFLGFRILRIVEPQQFRGLGIGPGDVVTSINGQPIERPAQAYEAFLALKSAPSLDIEYLRAGRTMRLSLPIVESSPRALDAQPPAASTSTPSGSSGAASGEANANPEGSGTRAPQTEAKD